MIAYIYTMSYIVATVGLVAWFIFQKNKIGRQASIVFFLGLTAYLGSLWLSPLNIPMKGFTLMRDLGVMAGVGVLFSIFRHNRFIAAGAFALLVFGFGTFYIELLQETIPNNRLFQEETSIEIDEDGELLIEVKEGYQIEQINTLIEQYELSYQVAFNQMASPDITDLDDYYVVNIPNNQLPYIAKIKADLLATSAIEYIENNEIIRLDDQEGQITTTKKPIILNDPLIQNQWGFEKINAIETHQLLKNSKIKPSKRALIAILDTGVDSKHEDIKGNFKSINKKYDYDKQAHGTHCAGIAAAVSYNGTGIASVVGDNKFVQVTSVKVLNDNGFGSQKTIIKGILEAADNGADVISMSLGGPSSDSRQKVYKKAFDYAKKKGAIIVVAAGNSNANAKDYVPAGVEGVISVSAVDNNLDRAVFSNYISDVKMGIAAPGVDIFSTLPNNNYGSFNGTSMACPHVAGVLGLMKSLQPNLTTQAAFDILSTTGINTKSTSETGKFIQPNAALQAVLNK